MGGNIFNKPRISPTEYKSLVSKLCSRGVLDTLYENFRNVYIPLSYSNKTDYGDIDVVCTFKKPVEEIAENLRKDLNLSEEHIKVLSDKNISFLFMDKVQVDLLHSDNYLFSYLYHCYNDLGGLLGTLCKAHGFKLKDDGLYYDVFESLDSTKKLGEILVYKDWNQVIHMLGLPPYLSTSHSSMPFDTLEDIFKYVASSPSFRVEFFLPESLTAKQRNRIGKRATYIKFLDWIRENKETLPSLETKPFHKISLFTACSIAARKASEIIDDHLEQEEFKKHFNGDLVAEWTGLQGKSLGALLNYLNQKSWFKEFILDPNTTTEMIKQYVKECTLQ